DPVTRSMAAHLQGGVAWFGADIAGGDGATLCGDLVCSVAGGIADAVLPVAEIPLFGAHNVLNVLAAVAITGAVDTGSDAMASAIREFRAVPHRLETVLDAGAVLWVNDSKATNAESAMVALRAFAGR